MSIAYIALGSNLGDKEANLRQALKMLLVKGLQIRSVSSFFKTEPYGVTDQPEFINAVACVKTDLAPEKLLKLLWILNWKWDGYDCGIGVKEI